MGFGLPHARREVAIEARKSIFSRIVLGAIGLSIALVIGLWFVTYQTVSATLDEAALTEVDVDLAGLVDIYASGGQAELEQRIADRLALTPSEGSTSHYLLANDAGERIAGDIDAWPALDPMFSETGEIVINSDSRGFARAVQLGPDTRLIVARRIDANEAILRNIGLAFLAGGAVLVALVALLGRFAALKLQRRIGQINLAFRSPNAPGATALVSPDDGDEIDELTAHSAGALARVRSLMTAYKDMSEQLAHEIRTPLSYLDNRLVKALAEQPEPHIAQSLADARAEIRHLVQTLESLLDIASSKARKGERAGLEAVDLSKLVSRICDLYAGSAEETGHSLDCNVAPGVTVQGEERQLGRLITNLLDNAIKYVPAGGRIEVELHEGPQLVVRDDGPGIAERDRARIFERFYRGDSAEAPGSGLGLALAQAIAERHALKLTLDETSQGASFRVSP